MKKLHHAPTLLVLSLLLGACSSMPQSTPLLDQTRSEFQLAQNDPNVSKYAPLELKQAGDALNQANAASTEHEDASKVDQLAYIARQKVALTREVTKQKVAEANVGDASSQRDQMRLQQRTMEADQANRNAKKSKTDAEMAKLNAEKSKLDADKANMDAAAAQSDSADAQRMTQEAQTRAALLETELAALAAKKTDRGMVITLGGVLFGTNMSTLNSQGMQTAQKLAKVLEQNPKRTVLIEGHTDSKGSDAHNQVLSENRANAVKASLQQLGVSADRIAVHGYGEMYPVASNTTAQNRQLNRRVEIVLSDENGKVAER